MKWVRMSKKSEKVKRWRKATKERIVEAMGGKCVCCGYDFCHDSLDLHHLDPTEKEIGIGKIRANPISWDRIVQELRKCVLVCCRCHHEIHAGCNSVPDNAAGFDESFVSYKPFPKQMTPCPVCGKEKNEMNKTCSYSCASRLSWKVDWDSIDLEDLLINQKRSFSSIADELDVSDGAVRKRARKLGLI